MAGSEPTPAERVLIVGSGAMACLFAARLAAAGVPVCMLVGWEEAALALERYGVRLLDEDGSSGAYRVQVVRREDSGSCTYRVQTARALQENLPVHFALVLVKSWQTERAAGQLAACLAQEGLALTLQNGLGNREILEAALGVARCAAGTNTLGATLLEPGRVRLAGEGSIGLAPHHRLEALAALLQSAGFRVEFSADLESLQWGKLLINAAINPLTALRRCTNGELLTQPALFDLLKSVVAETAAVAAALGIRLPYPDPLAAVETTARRTAANRSSMLQDVLRGAPTEIEAINGAVVRAGQRCGTPTPLNQALTRLVLALHPQEAAAADTPLEDLLS